jgi:adenylate cyclase
MPMARLVLTTPEGQEAVTLSPRNTLGRHPSNSIQLLDKIVSKEHCVIVQAGNEFILQDLGSLNGTFINGQRVEGERGLRDGDEIALGSTRALFQQDTSRGPRPQAQQGQGSAPHNPNPWGAEAPRAAFDSTGRPSPEPARQVSWAGSVSPASRTTEPNPAIPSQPHAQQGANNGPATAGIAGHWGANSSPAARVPHPPAAPLGASTGPNVSNPTHSGGMSHAGLPPLVPGLPTGVSPAPARVIPSTGTQPMAAHNFASPARPATLGTASLAIGANLQAAAVVTTGRKETLHRTRVDLNDAGRAIGNQVDATQGFLPYRDLSNNPNQLAADYERLRFSHELSREIALERDLTSLLNKILISVFRLIRADRGVIFLKDDAGELVIGASLRRDGSGEAISVSSTILEHVMKERATVLTHDAAMDFASKGKSMILNRISSAIVAPLLHNDELLGVLWLDSETLAQFQVGDLHMVSSIAAQAAMFIEISILGRKVEQEIVARERFSRLLSPNVAEKVLSGEMVIKRGGQAVNDCTVFNSDIRGFTPMSERMEPEVLVEILNEYFELMVESIFKFEGTLDKFMGDGIMALWGAPVAHPDDAFRAVNSALEQMRLLEEFNAQRADVPTHVPLQIGVGIHTGKVVAGYIGSSKALSYTVIGDTANTSARLCSIASAGQILVSEDTLIALHGRFEYRELSAAQLKGKERPFKVFEILGRHLSQGPVVASPSITDRTPPSGGVTER